MTTFCGWAREVGGPWHLAAKASTRKEAEDAASRYASQNGWRIRDIIALPEGEVPVQRRRTALNLVRRGK